MADEVDTLMHIRGSLQTTEGIDIVLEAGRLAELYNQASTGGGVRPLHEHIAKTHMESRGMRGVAWAGQMAARAVYVGILEHVPVAGLPESAGKLSSMGQYKKEKNMFINTYKAGD